MSVSNCSTFEKLAVRFASVRVRFVCAHKEVWKMKKGARGCV